MFNLPLCFPGPSTGPSFPEGSQPKFAELNSCEKHIDETTIELYFLVKLCIFKFGGI